MRSISKAALVKLITAPKRQERRREGKQAWTASCERDKPQYVIMSLHMYSAELR